MRKFVSLLVILAFVLAVGCAQQAAQPPVTAPVQASPPMAQVNPAAEATVPAQPAAPGAAASDSPAGGADVDSAYSHKASSDAPAAAETGAIGNRMEGTEVAGVNEDVPVGQELEEIKLTKEKTMSITEKAITKGTTLYWKNYDSWPHVLAVDSGSGYDTKRWGKSGQILEGNVWNFTFNDAGTFVVKDMFSGKMRMTVTVQ